MQPEEYGLQTHRRQEALAALIEQADERGEAALSSELDALGVELWDEDWLADLWLRQGVVHRIDDDDVALCLGAGDHDGATGLCQVCAEIARELEDFRREWPLS